MPEIPIRSPRPAARENCSADRPSRIGSAASEHHRLREPAIHGRAGESDSHFQIPRLRTLASHALPAMIESSLIPLVLFYVAMWAAGLWVALIVALLWSYGA